MLALLNLLQPVKDNLKSKGQMLRLFSIGDLNAQLHQVQDAGNNMNAKSKLKEKIVNNKIQLHSQAFANAEDQRPMPKEQLKEHSGMSDQSEQMTSSQLATVNSLQLPLPFLDSSDPPLTLQID
jgi:hypothetical protein